MIKFMWDECIPHEFVSLIYKQKYYSQINRPNLTYQKANVIVKKCLFEDMNQINHLKIKIEEKFDLIHFICSLLFRKIYNRANSFGIEKKNTFEFYFQTWKNKRNQKILKRLSTKALAKDPFNYEGCEVEKHEQVPIEVMLADDQLVRQAMVSNPADEIASKKTGRKKENVKKTVK